MTAKKAEASMTFNVFVKRKGGIFIAHCLELDIVATGGSLDQVEKDLLDLVRAQVDYAFTHDNLEYLYHPAPKEIWREFYNGNWHTGDFSDSETFQHKQEQILGLAERNG